MTQFTFVDVCGRRRGARREWGKRLVAQPAPRVTGMFSTRDRLGRREVARGGRGRAPSNCQAA